MRNSALEVHQFVPCLLPMDAVGNHTLGVQGAVQRAGLHGAIWAISIHDELSGRGRPYSQYPRARGARARLAMYQGASVAGNLVDFFLALRGHRKTLYYHGITPPEFFEPYDRTIAAGLRQARGEIERVAGQVRTAIATSAYTARELLALDVPEVVVIPPYVAPHRVTRPDQQAVDRLRAGKNGLDLLFVGRIAPNKGHEHLIRLASALRTAVDPNVRLFLVGGPGPLPYMRALRRLADRLAPSAVFFTGSVSDQVLAAHYATADAFVCTSEHEGFCIPLLEAMRSDLPIVAYNASAVGETLGGAGVLVNTTDPMVLAEIVFEAARDGVLRSDLRQRQQKRILELEELDRDALLIEALQHAAA